MIYHCLRLKSKLLSMVLKTFHVLIIITPSRFSCPPRLLTNQLSVIKSPSKQYTRHEALRCSWVSFQMSTDDTHLVLCPLPRNTTSLILNPILVLGCSVK